MLSVTTFCTFVREFSSLEACSGRSAELRDSQPRNTSPSRVSDVARRSDKIAKSSVISLLNASRGRHPAMIATTVGTANADCATPTQDHLPPFTSPEHVSTGENSRTKKQNVEADSSAEGFRRKTRHGLSGPAREIGGEVVGHASLPHLRPWRPVRRQVYSNDRDRWHHRRQGQGSPAVLSTAKSSDCSGRCESGSGWQSCRSVFVRSSGE